MIDKFSRTLIGCSIILSSFFVKFSNGESSDACQVALARLLLPPDYVGSCISAEIRFQKIKGSPTLNLYIESQNSKVLELEDLERTEGILANSQTPVFVANSSAADSESHSYPREPFIMEDIGEFTLYQNFNIKTSCELYTDEIGENIYGTIGLDTIFIGFGLESELIDENSTLVQGSVAVITVIGGINHFDQSDEPQEISIDVYEISGKTAYPELLIVADYTIIKNVSSKVDFVRGLLLWLNAADMLLSPLQSPRIHLNIAGILMAESYDALPYLQASLATERYLRLNKVMKHVEEEFYNKSDAFPLDCYDYAIVLTGNNICSKPDTECVNGRVSLKPNTVDKTMRYKDRINTAAIINIMIALPTQILITKKIAQLMGGKLVGEEDEDECPGIMDDYSSVSTPLKWAECSRAELTKFYSSPEAGSLWNDPQMCFAEKPENLWDDELNVNCICEMALGKLELPEGYVGSCNPVALRYDRVEGSPSLNISVESQDGVTIELVNLEQTEGILAGCLTPIYIANETSEFYENHSYFPDEKVMEDIGEFRLYRNYATRTSCELYTDIIGENIYGTVGLDTIFIGIGLPSTKKRHSIIVRGLAALITLTNGKNLLELNHTQTEISTEAMVSSGKEAYAELLLVADHVLVENQSRVEFMRQILLWMNAADMLLSPLQSPRIHLKIAKILISENDHTFSYVQKSKTVDGFLRLDTVMKNVEQEFYNKSNLLPLDTYDYVILFTGDPICTVYTKQCVDGRVSSRPNTVNKTLHYSDRIDTAAIININIGLPTQIVITKKLGQLMGARPIGEEDADECSGIMDEYSSILTSLNWSDCSVKEFSNFFRSRKAVGLWNSTGTFDMNYQGDDPNAVNKVTGNSSSCVVNTPDY